MQTTKQLVDNLTEQDLERDWMREQMYLLEQQVEEEEAFWNAYHSMEGKAESEKFDSLVQEGRIEVEKLPKDEKESLPF